MNIWEVDKALLFVVLFVPGFISIKVYELIVATEKRDFSKSIAEAVAYSALNFAVLWWPLSLISSPNYYEQHPSLYILILFSVFLIFPALWPVLFYRLSKLAIFKKHLLSPISQPWDHVFSNRESYWVVIHLTDGSTIRGKYAKQSASSAFPSPKEIYLEEVWRPGEKGGFKEKVPRSKGVIVLESQISHVEFFQ